jgi:hypothetical protein
MADRCARVPLHRGQEIAEPRRHSTRAPVQASDARRAALDDDRAGQPRATRPQHAPFANNIVAFPVQAGYRFERLRSIPADGARSPCRRRSPLASLRKEKLDDYYRSCSLDATNR